MDCSMLGFPILHYLPELAQTHVHWVSDTIQPSHSLSLPSLPALNRFQHQHLFQWVGSSRQVTKVLDLQHQSFQWIFRSRLTSPKCPCPIPQAERWPGAVQILPRDHLDPGKGAPVSWCCMVTNPEARGSTWGWATPLTLKNHSLPSILSPPWAKGIGNLRNFQFRWKRSRILGQTLDKEPNPSPEVDGLFLRTSCDVEGGEADSEASSENFYYLGLDHFNYCIETAFVV